jgi:hypothetical protein
MRQSWDISLYMMIHKKIRIHRRDAAFVYAILESLEGMASYSTLDSGVSDHRELKLLIAPGFAQDVETVLDGLRKKFPILEFDPKEKEET